MNGYLSYRTHIWQNTDKNRSGIPEWLEPEEITLDMAKRLIAYKNKISEEWLEKKTNESKNESDNETSEDTIKIKNKK